MKSITEKSSVSQTSVISLDGKKRSAGTVAAIAASAVILLSGLAYAFVPAVQNNAKLAALSTDDYYAQLMKKQASETAETMYDYMEKNSVLQDEAHNGTMSITAKEDFAKDYLELDKEYTLKANYLYNVKDSKMQFDSDVYVNSTKFLDLKTWANLKTGSFYLTAPMLTSKTAFLSQEYLSDELYTNSYYTNFDLTEKDIDTLIQRYLNIYLENAKGNTTLKKDTALSVGNVSGKYTKITVTLSGKELADFYKDILKAVKSDKAVMEMFKDEYNFSVADYKDQIEEQIKMIDEDVENGDYKNASLKIDTYVDTAGNIAGMKVVCDDENHGGKNTVEAYMLFNSKAEFGCKIAAIDNESSEGMSFVAQGKANGLSNIKALTGVTGTGVLTVSSNTYSYEANKTTLQKEKVKFKFQDLDLSELEDGYLSGKITASTDGGELDGVTVSAEFAHTGKQQTVAASVKYMSKTAFTFSLSDKEITPTEVTLPAKAYDMSKEEQAAAFAKSISFTKVEKAFKAEFSGLMTDEEIEEMFDSLEEMLSY